MKFYKARLSLLLILFSFQIIQGEDKLIDKTRVYYTYKGQYDALPKNITSAISFCIQYLRLTDINNIFYRTWTNDCKHSASKMIKCLKKEGIESFFTAVNCKAYKEDIDSGQKTSIEPNLPKKYGHAVVGIITPFLSPREGRRYRNSYPRQVFWFDTMSEGFSVNSTTGQVEVGRYPVDLNDDGKVVVHESCLAELPTEGLATFTKDGAIINQQLKISVFPKYSAYTEELSALRHVLEGMKIVGKGVVDYCRDDKAVVSNNYENIEVFGRVQKVYKRRDGVWTDIKLQQFYKGKKQIIETNNIGTWIGKSVAVSNIKEGDLVSLKVKKVTINNPHTGDEAIVQEVMGFNTIDSKLILKPKK